MANKHKKLVLCDRERYDDELCPLLAYRLIPTQPCSFCFCLDAVCHPFFFPPQISSFFAHPAINLPKHHSLPGNSHHRHQVGLLSCYFRTTINTKILQKHSTVQPLPYVCLFSSLLPLFLHCPFIIPFYFTHYLPRPPESLIRAEVKQQTQFC